MYNPFMSMNSNFFPFGVLWNSLENFNACSNYIHQEWMTHVVEILFEVIMY